MEQSNNKPRSRRKRDIVRAAKSGDRLETLIALRDLLAERLKVAKSDRDIASMSRRLMQCVEEIEALQAKKDAKDNNVLNGMRMKLSKPAIDHGQNDAV